MNALCQNALMQKKNYLIGITIEKEIYFQSNASSLLSKLCYNKEKVQCLQCQKEATAKCPSKGQESHTKATDSCENCRVIPTAKHSICEIGINNTKLFFFFVK